ncbi:unnamed protein product, partial [Mesorhabditis belari]|uniref:phosphatidylinositol-3,5-bisphosphate 3-phosphatase n=1 Tax=Mesorhabditis belari TaxID=2138241 RepID=A0AAF3JAC9_9BILA
MRFEDILTPRVDKVQLVDRWGAESNICGTVHVTTSHVIFKADEGSREIWLANGLIGTVERGSLSVAGCPLLIRCKHFMQIHLLINRDKVCQELYETLVNCSKPTNIESVVAFENRDQNEDARGWKRLEWMTEFSRQGVSSSWMKTDINANYKSCDTYPEQLWVPSTARTPLLEGSISFRSRGRFPVLTYFHRTNGAAIARCSQPNAGFRARCVEDETFMTLIGKANPHQEIVYLIDTRPMVNAMVNKVQGKGFEDERNYANIRSYFYDIENIHVMRSSQIKVVEACARAKTMTEYLKAIDSSGWLKHLRIVTECSLFIADSIAKGISCVIHCSDGWDRTSQTVSLAQLLLDPFFRTIHGFQVLIEKDWLGFGHKFDDRCAHIGANNEEAPKEISPVFSQWLDCVWQVWRMRPRAFQFNERFLIELHEHAYSCQYGTFLGNCDSDRKSLSLSTRTKSLWTHLDSRRDDFLNPFYEPASFGYLLDIDIRASSFVVWSGLYNRFDEGILPREDIYNSTMATIEHVGILEAHVAQLRNKLVELKQQLGKSAPGNASIMADSGHGSSSGAEGVDGIQSPTSVSISGFGEESGYCEGLLQPVALKWMSERDATSCSSPNCGFEFTSRSERRMHCYRCGKIFCRRCVHLTSDERERVCNLCNNAS